MLAHRLKGKTLLKNYFYFETATKRKKTILRFAFLKPKKKEATNFMKTLSKERTRSPLRIYGNESSEFNYQNQQRFLLQKIVRRIIRSCLFAFIICWAHSLWYGKKNTYSLWSVGIRRGEKINETRDSYRNNWEIDFQFCWFLVNATSFLETFRFWRNFL